MFIHNFRKPARTIHIDPCGSASLVKNSQKIQSIPKELHHSIQHVRTSLSNLNQELELYVTSKEDLHNNNEDICDASGDEEGILAIRTCKSQEDRFPPIGNVPDIHVVNILNPKTPQKLYYTFDYSCVNTEHDTTDSSSTSSSEGFVPPSQSTSTKHSAVIPVANHQDTDNLSVESKTVKSSGTVRSRSCSPQPTKVLVQQQKPLKELSVNVVKLPHSVIASRNTNVIDPAFQGILSSDETSKIHTFGNLVSSEDMECTESNIPTPDIQNQRLLTEQTTKPTTGNDLLCEESEYDAVSCVASDNNTPKNEKDANNGLDDYSKAEVGVYSSLKETHSPGLQMDYKGKSNVDISLCSSKQEENSDKLTYKESNDHQENPSKQSPSKIKNVALPDSETECEENVKLEETLTVSTRSKKTDKKHSKKVKSEKYVVSPCSENETGILPKKPMPKPSTKHHKSSFHNHTSSRSKSNMPTVSSGSEREECSKNVSLCEDVKSEHENSCALENASQSILSYSDHEETVTIEMSKVHTGKSPTSPTSTFTITTKHNTSSPEQSCTSRHEYSRHQTDYSVSITNKSEDKTRVVKPSVVKRKLNMTDCSKEDVTEVNDTKRHATKYKLRSKGIAIMAIVI